MHKHVEASPKWSQYYKDLTLVHTPKSAIKNHSEKELHETLTKAGFTNIVVELKRQMLVMRPEDFVPLIKSVQVQIENIPAHLLDEYMTEYVQLAIDKQLLRITADGGYEFDFNIYVAFGQRPE